jgi:DNA-binding GntR family transcriptional regulator
MGERLSEKAYRLIKDKIITLDLPPAELINEQALMEDLGLGRTPIREALLQLAQEDLVTVAPRRGMFVSDIRITDLQKIFEVRIVLEGLCARLAAQRITEDQLAQMSEVIEDLRGVSEEDIGALMASDAHFHALLYQAAQNEFLADLLDRLYAPSLRMWYLVLNRLGNVRAAIEEHAAVLEALQAGDADMAEALMQEHVIDFQQQIKAVL